MTYTPVQCREHEALRDPKHLRRIADETPSPSLSGFLLGLCTGGLAVFFGAVMFIGWTA